MSTRVDITGNTYPVKDRIKALGGRWNGVSKCWSVPADKADEARALVAGNTPVATPVVTPQVAVDWSDEQKAIFAWFESGKGNLIVQARAGTGKTTTIKQAFTFAPEQGELLYAVFNKKNQKEAAEKITDARVSVRTLHSLGFWFIKNVWSNAQPDDNVEFARIADVCGEDLPEDVSGVIARLVGFCKNLFVSVPDINAVLEVMDSRNLAVSDELAKDWPDAKIAQAAIGALNATLERDAAGRVSFNDMVWLPVAAGWVKPTFELVVVDEAQDMNMPQLMMAERACKGRVCVVGDNRQAIYGFRGAASDGMHLMKQRLNAAELGLTTTYRCPKSVVALAQEIVSDYSAAPAAPEGEVVATSLPQVMESLTVGDAVLSRLNAPLMGVALSLLRRGIPARIEGRDIGKQLVAMVKKMRAKSVPDFLRKVSAWSEKQAARITASGGRHVQSKIELVNDQAATLTTVADGCKNVDEVIARITNLFEDSDKARRPAVVCSSVHKAKGLEWNRVVLVAETFKNRHKSEEEANIYYVAVTRAKRTLLLAEPS
jgi:ATP-dependent DNA helicase UvrD/PcrA